MNRDLLIRTVTIDWDKIPEDSYLHGIEAISSLNALGLEQPVTFFTGENGTGKSTLLEAIAVACGFNPEGGTRNYRFSTYDSHSELSEAIGLIRNARKIRFGYFLRAESFYNVATREEEYSKGPGGIPMHFHEMSHGESFLKLAQNFFLPGGLYLLDEPEAALSPQRQLTLMKEIHDCVRKGAQFLIVTHSPILLAMPDSKILSFDDGPVHACAYEETLSVRLTSLFINNRAGILHQLLDEPEELPDENG